MSVISVMRRLKDSIGQIANRSGEILTPAEAKLASDLLIGISESQTRAVEQYSARGE